MSTTFKSSSDFTDRSLGKPTEVNNTELPKGALLNRYGSDIKQVPFSPQEIKSSGATDRPAVKKQS